MRQSYIGQEVFRISWKLKQKVRDILSEEQGTVYKSHAGKVRVCLVWPNVYALGMTNLGFQTVCRLLNDMENCVCERAFLPSKEDALEFSRTGTELFSHETQTPLHEFDIIAFSVSFEDDYFNIPAILSLANIPVRSSERRQGPNPLRGSNPLRGQYPVIIAGGAAVSLNPEPLAEICDLFLLGEGEGALTEFIALFERIEKADISRRRQEAVRELDSLPFVYVPSLYEFEYDGAKVRAIRPLRGAKERIRACKNLSLDNFIIPQSFIRTPSTGFGGTPLVEIERGCGRGCRFCVAGFLYLPPRSRNADAVKEAVESGIKATGKAGLVGAAVSEYPQIKELLRAGVSLGAEVTLSSLRTDMLDAELLALLNMAGYKTVTLAPEAGSQRMRGVINKGIDDRGIMEAVSLITEAGFTRIKLYFLIGLPLEEDADAEAVVDLSLRIKAAMKKGSLALSVNPFIPKPFTPFQWHGFADRADVQRRLAIIKKGIARQRGVTMSAMSANEAFTQAYVSRADRRASEFIIEASIKGPRRAAKAVAALMEESVHRQREHDEILPWDLIDHGLKKDYLWKEYRKGLDGKPTPACNVGACLRCGVC
ncbi:MAG: radical SAM protein [Deltaproteobacteria bacterium]|nr:radical SAM protein [Deltaproteobacteria bacterium]